MTKKKVWLYTFISKCSGKTQRIWNDISDLNPVEYLVANNLVFTNTRILMSIEVELPEGKSIKDYKDNWTLDSLIYIGA
jgi:hypothetical protein